MDNHSLLINQYNRKYIIILTFYKYHIKHVIVKAQFIVNLPFVFKFFFGNFLFMDASDGINLTVYFKFPAANDNSLVQPVFSIKITAIQLIYSFLINYPRIIK